MYIMTYIHKPFFNHSVKLQKHDDRLDALAMAVKWVDQMAADADVKIGDRRDELFDMELEVCSWDSRVARRWKQWTYVDESVTVGMKGKGHYQ